jgi:hypothetical protein
MAEKPDGVEGNIAGKPIPAAAQQKIMDVLKSTLQAELETHKPTVGAEPGHGSVTHGAVTKAV